MNAREFKRISKLLMNMSTRSTNKMHFLIENFCEEFEDSPDIPKEYIENLKGFFLSKKEISSEIGKKYANLKNGVRKEKSLILEDSGIIYDIPGFYPAIPGSGSCETCNKCIQHSPGWMWKCGSKEWKYFCVNPKCYPQEKKKQMLELPFYKKWLSKSDINELEKAGFDPTQCFDE